MHIPFPHGPAEQPLVADGMGLPAPVAHREPLPWMTTNGPLSFAAVRPDDSERPDTAARRA